MRKSNLMGGAAILVLTILVGIGLWKTTGSIHELRAVVVRHPEGIMGTACTLAAVVGPKDEVRAEAAIAEAESVLRGIEARMSIWLADSEISRFNAADEGREVALSAETVEVLRAARAALDATGGAFDVTCRPLIELWRRSGEAHRLPTDEELERARASSSWALIQLTDSGAVKRAAAARVDLGGIAKGYAIDRAVDVLERAGLVGGLVDVGGDLRCFGRPPEGVRWRVEIKDPFGPGRLVEIRLPGGAMCTSGNYARFVEIEGKRYSHIIDPRTGRPASAVPSATVTAQTAMEADIWATALSVLGPPGLKVLAEADEALLILGSARDYHIRCTEAFRSLLQNSALEMVLED